MTTDVAYRQGAMIADLNNQEYEDYDDEASSKLFERARIKTLAGEPVVFCFSLRPFS